MRSIALQKDFSQQTLVTIGFDTMGHIEISTREIQQHTEDKFSGFDLEICTIGASHRKK